MPVFKQGTQSEQEFWNANAKHSVVISRYKLAQLLGNSRGDSSLSMNTLREYLYSIGIRPDEFIARRHTMSAHDIEIRVAGPEVMALIELSGLLKG